LIKSGIKNYFSNLKYFFTPLGVLAAGVLLGLSIFIPGLIDAVSTLSGELAEIIEEVSVDTKPFKEYLYDAVFALDWNDPVKAVQTIISRDWLIGAITDCYGLFEEELAPYSEQITQAVNTALDTISLYFAALIFFAVLGFICGYFFTGFLVRRNSAKRSFGKFILSLIIGSLFTALLISVNVWLATLWKPSLVISGIITVILYGLLSLTEAYILYGRNKVTYNEVINFKNVLKLNLVNFIIFFIALAFTIITILITNIVVGFFIGFAFLEIAFLVININADSYVKNLIPEQQSADE